MESYKDFKFSLTWYNFFNDAPIEQRARLIEHFLKSLKNERNLFLEKTDKYLLPDFPITQEQLEIVKQYRKQLRDFTKNNYIMPNIPDFIITLDNVQYIWNNINNTENN
jgi:hypothetical protein